jgi:hypothetical protein
MSFPLDIYGNPITLGCQMDKRARFFPDQATGIFLVTSILQSATEKRLKANPAF